MTTQQGWNVKSFMKQREEDVGIQEESFADNKTMNIRKKESLRRKSSDIEEEEEKVAFPKANDFVVEESESESWLDRQINTFTAALGCGPIISLPKFETTETPTSPLQSIKRDLENERVLSPASSTVDKRPTNDNVFVLDVFLQKQLKSSANHNEIAPEPTTLNSSSSEEIDSQDRSNPQSDPNRTELGEKAIHKKQNDHVTERRLYMILGVLLMVLVVVLVVFLPNWDGKPDSSASSTIASPTFAPTTGKPTMAPTFGDPAIVLTFLFDDFPEEISWEVMDSMAGMVVDDLPSFTYEAGIKAISHRIPVQINREYTLTIYDEGVDGLCCDTPGEYFIMFRGEQLVFGEGNFGARVSHTFVIPEIV